MERDLGDSVKILEDFCEYLSRLTSINKELLLALLISIIIFIVFAILKYVFKILIKDRIENIRKIYFINQSSQVLLNIIEIILLLFVWSDYFKNLMTLISVVSAAMTIALREVIVNFFCGLYIGFKRPFRVEDRIQIDDLKGDVTNISAMNFEVLEVSNKEENGQSTGVVVTFPNSIILTKPVKNINKGFKYIWNEITISVCLDCNLVKNKQELYKIVNGIETIKSIPHKMVNEIQRISPENRVYFNKYDPIIYTKIVDTHIDLTIRYLMLPKKARYIESVIWNKIYIAFKEGRINLYLGSDPPELHFDKDEDNKFKPNQEGEIL